MPGRIVAAAQIGLLWLAFECSRAPGDVTPKDASGAVAPRHAVIPLFNGRDLAGLRTWLVDSQRDDPRSVFTVTNGCLRISGDGLGYIGTERAYRDYRCGSDTGERV